MSKGKHKRSTAFSLKQRKAELLRDPARAVEYLNHALQDGDETDFRLALADVVRSRKLPSWRRPQAFTVPPFTG